MRAQGSCEGEGGSGGERWGVAAACFHCRHRGGGGKTETAAAAA